MALTDVQWIKLIVGLFFGGLVLLLCYMLPSRRTVPFLILAIPFQLIESPHGSVNMVVTYLVAVGLLFRGEIRRLPLIWAFSLVLLAYLISFSQAPPGLYRIHAEFVVTLVASFLMFFITYNYLRNHGDVLHFSALVLALNVLMVIYCFVQLAVGERGLYLGTPEIGLHRIRSDQRLTGPFYATAMTAEFLVIQAFFCLHLLFSTRRRSARVMLLVLIAMDLALLVATGNRGGFLVLIGGAGMFLLLYRREVSSGALLRVVAAGVVVTVCASLVVVRYTSTNQLFDRLAETEIQEGVPDTRQVTWSMNWEHIVQKPLLGHGPRFRVHSEPTETVGDHPYLPYPHSLYLFLLATVGALGLVTFVILFLGVFLRISSAAKVAPRQTPEARLLKMGMLTLILFSVDQIRMEFLRLQLADFQQFLFFLLGGFLAVADVTRERVGPATRERSCIGERIERASGATPSAGGRARTS